MKSNSSNKRFPRNKAEWQDTMAHAPSKVPYDPATDPYDPNDPKATEAFWKDAVMVRGGGPAAVHKALAEKRRRGPQKAPTKRLVSLRLSEEVLKYFKSSGPGWQTRIDETLRAIISSK